MTPLHQLLQDLLQYQATLNRSQHTIESTRSTCTLFLHWLHNTHQITTAEDLLPCHLHAYQQHLSAYTTARGLPLKPSALNTRIKGLRRLLAFLHDRNYTHHPLADEIHYITEPKVLPTSVLTHKQIKQLLRAVDTTTTAGIRDRAAIELLYSAGLRVGELQRLQLDHVDLDCATVKVTGKGDKERLVPIGKTAVRHLTSYIRGARPFLAAAHAHPTRTLFLNARGRPLPGYALRHALHAYAHKAKLHINVTPHTLRRSCTTEMIKADANLYHVKEILGHETFHTLKHYTKLQIRDLQKTHAKCHPRERDPD